MSDEARSEAEEKPTFLEELPTLVAAVVVALLIRTFLFQTFYVPSDSMFPTMLVGDHVFVNKFFFGARVPWTELQLPRLREPERGEVVVFHLARDPHGGIFPAHHRCHGLPQPRHHRSGAHGHRCAPRHRPHGALKCDPI